MRLLFTTLTILSCIAGSAMALETAAGTDTVNTSQVGINAKVDASNVILKTGISQITACGPQGKLWNGSACAAAAGTSAGTPMQFYQCPVNINGVGGDWESIGCIGQIGNQSVCTNYNYNHGLKHISYACTPITLRVN